MSHVTSCPAGAGGGTRTQQQTSGQLWGEGSAIIEGMKRQLTAYALCGRTLARGHARSGDTVTISAYLDQNDAMDQALADFAELLRRPEPNCDTPHSAPPSKTGRVKAQAGL